MVSAEAARILDLAYDAIFLLALDGTIQFWNRGAESLYGWSRHEALGGNSHQLLHTRFPIALSDIHRQVKESGQWEGTLTHTARDGRVLTVSSRWSLNRRPGEQEPEILEINRDITEQTENEMITARLAAIVENSDDAIIGKTTEGIVENWNRGAERLYGYSAAEMKGRSIAILLPAGHTDEETAILRKIQAGERVEQLETVRIRKDGSPVEVDIRVSPIRDHEGRITGASHIARDITERKRFERRIRELNETLEARVEERTRELRETNEELETFSYSVSHDLRGPLRAIDGFSRLLMEQAAAKLDGQERDRLDRIRAAAQRMGELIDALLELSRLSRGPVRLEQIDVSALARNIANELARTPPRRDVAVKVQPGMSARCDPRLIAIVLENLLGNAFKFTAKTPRASIEFGCDAHESGHVFFVRDNGAGFDMTHADQLFRPFQRLHSQTEFEGNGIGLVTVARILRRLGGRIWAESRVGRGASFYFTLNECEQGCDSTDRIAT